MSQTKAQLLDGKSSSIQFSTGSASSPTVSFTGDTNTGIYSPGADQVAISTGGTGRLFVDSSGRVGLGSSTPQKALVVSDGGAQGIEFSPAETGLSRMLAYNRSTSAYAPLNIESSTLQIVTGAGTNALFIDSSQRVGIGTTSPGRKLSLADPSSPTLGFYRGSTEDGLINSDSNAFAIQAFNSTPIKFSTVSGSSGFSERAQIDSSGRLLVGTSSSSDSATMVLAGYSGGANNPSILWMKRTTNASSITTGGGLGVIKFGSLDSGHGATIEAFADGTWSSTSDCPAALAFSTTADGASSPTERLRIAQNAQMTYNFASNDAFRLVNSTSGDKTGAIQIYNSGTLNDFTGLRFNVNSNGNVTNTNNSYGAISDIKLKENIVDAGSQWSDIKDLQVRKYNFKEGQTHTQIGLVAQEVELVSPGLVSESPDRDADGNDLGTVTKSVNYSVLYMKAVKALQEAMERIEQLETEMAAVKAQLS